MKVKNLLLAGLAVAAMTACSNNDIDEIVDNGIQTPTEEASMRLYFNFANQTTRANGDTTGDKQDGNDLEWTVDGANITVLLQYPNDAKDIVIKNLSPVSGKENTYATEEFKVNAGSGVKVYAFINPENLEIGATTNPTTLTLTTAQTLPSEPDGLAYLVNGVAKDKKFMMSGSTSLNIQAGADGTVNIAKINVDRVAAKLDEGTKFDTSISIANDGIKYKNKDNGEANVSIKLLAYSYSNLTNNTYALNGIKEASFNAEDIYLQPYFSQGSYPTDGNDKKDYRWIAKDELNKITYCLDNYGNNNPTRVHYKGQVCIDGKEISSNFYIRALLNLTNNVEYYFFNNLDEMKAYYKDETINSITEETTREELSKLGIKKYNSGICYYEADIKTTLESQTTVSIMRNNWYKLTVKNIKEIGYPTPAKDPEDKDTKLVVETTINPWTIQINDFDL